MMNQEDDRDFFTELTIAEQVARKLALHKVDEPTRVKLEGIAYRYALLEQEWSDILNQIAEW